MVSSMLANIGWYCLKKVLLVKALLSHLDFYINPSCFWLGLEAAALRPLRPHTLSAFFEEVSMNNPLTRYHYNSTCKSQRYVSGLY